MASCYAAIVSLQTTIRSILNHPNPPISLDHNQAEALIRNSTFLQNFLEHHSHREDYPTAELKNKIRDAVYAAEDLIEKSTVSGSWVRCHLQQIAESGIPFDTDTDEFWMKRIMEDYNLGISVAIDDMDAIIKEITEDDKEKKPGDLQLVSSISSLPFASPSAAKKTATVEFDVLNKLLDMLTCQKYRRQIIRITGMGGIGKTTHATQAYQRFFKVRHFDIRVWVKISQNFREREFLLDILCQLFVEEDKEYFYKIDNEQMLLRIYQRLMGRRYLIVLDDVWSIDEELRMIIDRYFPDEKNGSRMIITSRVSNIGVSQKKNVGDQLSNTSCIQMNLLDDDQSWKLLVETVFKGEVCPFELEEIGKTIQ